MPAEAVERRLTAILAGQADRAARSSLPLLDFALDLMPAILPALMR